MLSRCGGKSFLEGVDSGGVLESRGCCWVLEAFCEMSVCI